MGVGTCIIINFTTGLDSKRLKDVILEYRLEKTTLVIVTCLTYIQVDMFQYLLWHHQNKLNKKYVAEVDCGSVGYTVKPPTSIKQSPLLSSHLY